MNRTGIDYYYQVEEIAPSAMTQGLKSDYYANAALLQMPPKGKTVGTGFLAADSRWKYLDAGHDLELLQNYLLSKTVGPPPGSTVELRSGMASAACRAASRCGTCACCAGARCWSASSAATSPSRLLKNHGSWRV